MNDKARPNYPEKLRFVYSPWGHAKNVIDISLDGPVLIGNFGYWDGKRIPTNEEWKRFRADIDRCGLWNWNGRYLPEGGELICDGTPWKIWIRWGDKVKRSSGDGEFPRSFSRVLKAIKQLIAKRELT